MSAWKLNIEKVLTSDWDFSTQNYSEECKWLFLFPDFHINDFLKLFTYTKITYSHDNI